MLRFAVDHLCRSSFDDFSPTQDDHLVADMLDDGKVMRNEQISDPQFRLQIRQQVDDLGLNTDIERADRFIADDERRFRREGPRDPDPLPLAAAEFVRKSPQKLGFQPDSSQEISCPLFSLRDIRAKGSAPEAVR